MTYRVKVQVFTIVTYFVTASLKKDKVPMHWKLKCDAIHLVREKKRGTFLWLKVMDVGCRVIKAEQTFVYSYKRFSRE